MKTNICEKIRKQAKGLVKLGKPAYLLHVSKKKMNDIIIELYGENRDNVSRLELSWMPDNIMVEKTQYLTGNSMEWSDVTKDTYDGWNTK